MQCFFFFFFQAEDGIRDYKVTGVQTCALPISDANPWRWLRSRRRTAGARELPERGDGSRDADRRQGHHAARDPAAWGRGGDSRLAAAGRRRDTLLDPIERVGRRGMGRRREPPRAGTAPSARDRRPGRGVAPAEAIGPCRRAPSVRRARAREGTAAITVKKPPGARRAR